MSDLPSQEQDLGPGEAEARTTSVGLYLAGQRRLRGISVDDLAARTRIPRRNIERLEAGAFDAAPDGFSRGFVRTVAQALGLDADEAVMRLMSEPQVDETILLRERRASLLLRGAILTGLVLIGVAVWKLVAAVALPTSPSVEPPVVYRRDPVRLLAADTAAQSRLVESRPVETAIRTPEPPAEPASSGD